MNVETIPVQRWACPCGRFVGEAHLHSEDRIDPGSYYGITSASWFDCSRCGRVEGLPRLIQIGEERLAGYERVTS